MNRALPLATGVAGLLVGLGVGFIVADDADEVDRLEAEVAGFEGAQEEAEAEAAATPNVRYEATQAGLGGFIVDGDEDSVAMNFDFTPETQMRDLLDGLGFNATAMLQRMASTRAFDGTLTAEGDGVQASWTYHPDDGMTLIIEVTE